MKRTTKLFMMMLVLAVSAGLTSCELLGIADNPVSPRLKVKASSMTVKVGDTKKCPVSASTKAKLLYGSSDETVATVDANGLVTGVKEGDAVITVVATNQEGSDLFLEESAIVTVKVVKEYTEEELEAEEIAEVVALLEEAQEEGSLTSMYYTIDDTDYEAVFKKEGDQFVLQELKSNKAATRTLELHGATLEVVNHMTGRVDDGTALVNDITDEDINNIIDGEDVEAIPDPTIITDEHGATWEIDDDALYDNLGVANSVDYQWTDEDEEDYQNPVDEGDAAADDEPAIAPADQALHFMVTDKATGEVLIDSYTNLGNLETQQQTIDIAQVKDQVTVNGKTKETNKAQYYCKISLPNKNKVKITYNKKQTTWAQLADSQKNLEIKDKKVAYKSGHKYYWVLKDQYSGLSENTVVNYKEIYKSSAEVKGIWLYTNVDKSVYSTTWEKNQFRNGDKFQVRIEFSKNSDGANMRDMFNVNVSKGSVTVEHVTGTLNVFEITANVAPTGEKKVEEFEVNFGYCDYNRLIKTCTLKGGVNLYSPEPENPVIDSTDDFEDGGDPLK